MAFKNGAEDFLASFRYFLLDFPKNDEQEMEY